MWYILLYYSEYLVTFFFSLLIPVTAVYRYVVVQGSPPVFLHCERAQIK